MLRVEDGGADPTRAAATPPVAAAPPDLPDWLDGPAPPPPATPTRRPASGLQGEDPEAPRPGAGLGAERARERGTAIHAVLERAPDWPEADRPAKAGTLLALLVPWADAAARAAMATEALAALRTPGAEAFFAPGALAEAPVSLSAAALGLAGAGRVSGRIDRLAVGPDLVRAVDFKTDAAPAAAPEAVPEAYLRQMAAYRAALRALYPGRVVELSLLWTATASLMILNDEALDGALARLAADWTRDGPLLDPRSPPS
jgi:ATP-dependent helicase/nuclease subunit A